MLLYKYLKCEQKNILENGLIRFTQPSYFNDPFEALPTIEQMVSNDLIEALYTSFSNDSLFNDLISKIDNKESRKNLELARKKFIDSDIHHKLLFHDKLSGNTEYDLSCEFQKYWDSQVGILCLAENDSNLTMWSHYSENHTGFLIGFNSQKDITDSKQCLIKPNRIQYVCKRPHITLLDSKNKRGDQYLYQIINTFLYTKSKDWVNEGEWRQVNKLKEYDKKVFINDQEIYLFHYNRDAIEEIILGCRMPPEHEENIIQITNNWKINIYKMVLNKNNYTLNKIKIK